MVCRLRDMKADPAVRQLLASRENYKYRIGQARSPDSASSNGVGPNMN
jgi:hypothetical protein